MASLLELKLMDLREGSGLGPGVPFPVRDSVIHRVIVLLGPTALGHQPSPSLCTHVDTVPGLRQMWLLTLRQVKAPQLGLSHQVGRPSPS